MSEREVELTTENAGQLLFGTPAQSPEPTEANDSPPTVTEDEAASEPNPEPVESGSDGADFADALLGQSASSKRAADRALVASMHPQLEPTEGGDAAADEPPNPNAGEVAALALHQGKDAPLVASIHEGVPSGGGTDGFDGGARIDYNAQRPHSQEGVFVHPRDEIGWGNAIEIEDGASLIFPWLEND